MTVSPPERNWRDAAIAVLTASPDGMLLVDRAGKVVQANPQAAELLATTLKDLVGRSVEEFIPESRRGGHEQNRATFAAKPRTRSMGAGLDLVALRCDGTTFPADIALSQVTLDGEQMVIASIRDISERRVADVALRLARERIATMEDRARIARDLHDTVIQEIFGAGLLLQSILGRVEDEVALNQITDTVEQLDKSISSLRNVIFDLKTAPQQGRVRLAVDDLLSAVTRELGFAPRLSVVGDLESLEADHTAHLVPILRETLTNVAKHAAATRVHVAITVGADLELVVEDNGIGMESAGTDGFGMTNMAGRATDLGGTFEVTSPGAKGTRIVWRVPLATS